jgi:hypothetical protein
MVKDTECDRGCTPEPDREITATGLEASLMTLTLPVTFPLAVGAKVTSNVPVCPGVWMRPAEAPLTLKPGPEMLIFEKVTSELPDAASVTARVVLLPTATFPNFKFDGLALICPGAVTVRVAALLTTVSVESVITTAKRVPLSEVVVTGVV